MSEFMKNRDDSPYVRAALNGLDFADFGQLSPAQQSLVLMRAAQIQQRDRGPILLEGDPMFGAPGSNAPETRFGFPTFGKIDAISTTNNALGGGGANGGQSAQYALGGPRSAQFTVKLQF